MKLFLLTFFFGATAVSATEYATLRGSSTVEYAPPAPVDYDLATLWDELAAEATFMQIQVSEGRTLPQCKNDCNKAKGINRGRCRQNCEQIDDKGGSSTTRTLNCDDCRALNPGNRRDRCMNSCRQGQERKIETCRDADTCGECRVLCGTGKLLDNCLDDLRCSSNNRDGRSCDSASNCGNCNSFCTGRDRKKCRADYCSAEELAKVE